MKRWSNIIWALAAIVWLTAGPAFAQGGGASSTGSISGEIKDAQGGVLPGVTVTATSPAQIGALTAVTNEAGIYRFPSVPPGEYRLDFELAGFQNVVREGIRITLGFNAQVNVSLGVATLQETVTVSGESPVIDTSATRMQTNYDQQMLASIPNARDMWSLLATTPSVTLNRVDVGGSTAGTQTTYFAYGYSGQNRPLIEGINTTEGTAAAGFYLDYGSFEEVFIGAAANSAEMPNPGVLTQFVGKSGSNQLGINLYYDYENGDIQARNLTEDQAFPIGTPAAQRAGRTIREDSNRLASYKNFNLGVGGPIVRDRVWGHFAYLNQQNSVGAPPAGSFLDGTPFNTKLFNYTGKATYQMNQNNKFIGYLQHGTKQQPNRTDNSNRISNQPIHTTFESTLLQDSPSWVYKGEWNGTIGQNMFAEFRAGQFGYNFGLISNTTAPRYEDLATNVVEGGGRDWLNKRRRNQYTGALSFFKDNFARRLAQLEVRRRVPRRVGQHPVERSLRGQRRPLPAERRAELSASLEQRHQRAERAGDDQLLRHRLVDGRSPDAQRRRALRSLSRVAAGADDAGVALQPGGRDLSRELVGGRVQPHRAAHRRQLRHHWATGRPSSRATGAASTSTPASTSPTRSTRTRATSTPTSTGTTPTATASSRTASRPPLQRPRRRPGGGRHRSQPEEPVHRRGLGLRRASDHDRPRHPHRLRVEEGQRRLAAPQRPAAVQRLQRAGLDRRSGSGRQRRDADRQRPEPPAFQPRRPRRAARPTSRRTFRATKAPTRRSRLRPTSGTATAGR